MSTYEEEYMIDTIEVSSETEYDASNRRWTDEATIALINLYGNNIGSVGMGSKYLFRNKKQLWDYIYKKLIESGHDIKNAKQAENKFTALLRQYRKVKDNNRNTGNGRKIAPYENELDAIFATKDTVNPVILLSSDVDFEAKSPTPIKPMQSIENEIESPPTPTPEDLPKKKSPYMRKRKLKFSIAEEFKKFREDKAEYNTNRLNLLKERIEDKKKMEEEKRKDRCKFQDKLLELLSNK